MKRVIQLAAISSAVLIATSAEVNAGLITFDGLTTTRASFTVLGIEQTYQGYEWGFSETSGLGSAYLPSPFVNGWAAQYVSPGSTTYATPVSGNSFAWNNGGPNGLFIDFQTPHDVDSVYLAKFNLSPSYTANASSVQLFGYDVTGSLVGSTNAFSLTDAFERLDVNISGARFLEIRGRRSNFFAVDDLLVAQSNLSVVPEPASMALWGLGSLGIGVIARRRKKQQADLSA